MIGDNEWDLNSRSFIEGESAENSLLQPTYEDMKPIDISKIFANNETV